MGKYTINGKDADVARLHVLAETYNAESMQLLKNIGLAKGMSFLELGCGIGRFAIQVANEVGSNGNVVAIDISEERSNEAKAIAKEQSIDNISFRKIDVRKLAYIEQFDIVYARFLLTHLDTPKSALEKMLTALKPGGLIVIEDADIAGIVHYPENNEVQAGLKLYDAGLRSQGSDPDISCKLPGMFYALGLKQIGVNIVQPVFMSGPRKSQISPALSNMSDILLANKLVTKEKLFAITDGINKFVAKQENLITRPRRFQVWGRR